MSLRLVPKLHEFFLKNEARIEGISDYYQTLYVRITNKKLKTDDKTKDRIFRKSCFICGMELFGALPNMAASATGIELYEHRSWLKIDEVYAEIIEAIASGKEDIALSTVYGIMTGADEAMQVLKQEAPAAFVAAKIKAAEVILRQHNTVQDQKIRREALKSEHQDLQQPVIPAIYLMPQKQELPEPGEEEDMQDVDEA